MPWPQVDGPFRAGTMPGNPAYSDYALSGLPAQVAQPSANNGAFLTPSLPGQIVDQHTRMVNRAPRLVGNRWLYSRGGVSRPWFRMVSTGQVESSKFQRVNAHTWTGEFNDAIYQAGYPRNLGYLMKVSTIQSGSAALAKNQPKMQPKPQITRSFYTRRAFTSGVKPMPLVGTPPPGNRNGR